MCFHPACKKGQRVKSPLKDAGQIVNIQTPGAADLDNRNLNGLGFVQVARLDGEFDLHIFGGFYIHVVAVIGVLNIPQVAAGQILRSNHLVGQVPIVAQIAGEGGEHPLQLAAETVQFGRS